ncbi:MAG: hypothetical protein RQ723_00935 [Desulfuromonadales bacterium]|nr:hypothetical protein [Desulfuromonadales bacterium]
MTGSPRAWQRYLARRSFHGPWRLAGVTAGRYAGAVVIPSLAEGESLFATLASLATNTEQLCRRWLVVVVVNQPEASPADVCAQNRADLARLAASAADYPFALAWVDAASPGRRLPVRQAGVGLARKLGMDLALAGLDTSLRPIFACLDADTLVEPDYLSALETHFQASPAGGAVLPFCHQPAGDLRQQQAIDRYELYLRGYVLGLSLAGSPYAFTSIGSAMACRADAYVRCDGMSRRAAAEDFHFLNKLAKTAGVARLHGTTVHPSARASQRAPFGTGQNIARQLAGERDVIRFYPLEPFVILGDWLRLVQNGCAAPPTVLLQRAEQLSPVLADFLVATGWATLWPRLLSQHRDDAARLRAFHTWFDGLQTLRLVHRLCDTAFPRDESPGILVPLFARGGLGSMPAEVAPALQRLRQEEFAPA